MTSKQFQNYQVELGNLTHGTTADFLGRTYAPSTI